MTDDGKKIRVTQTSTRRPCSRPSLSAASIVLIAALSTAGCSGILAGGEPPKTFDLTVPANLPRGGGGGRGNLVVVEPVAVAVIDGQRIVVKPNSGEVTYLGAAQWSDRLPKLVQAKIIEAYENSNRLKSVGRPGDRLAVDYQLVSELRAFEIEAGTNQAVVELTAKIVNDKTGKIVAAEVFTARRPLEAKPSGETASRALNGALGEVLAKLVGWTGQRV